MAGASQFSSSRDQALFLLGLLGAGEAFRAGVGLQFRRHGTFGAQKQKRQFLQPGPALRGEHFGPPVGGGEIAAREREFLEIILERQPGALRVRAGGEDFQELVALVDGGLGIGQLPAQVGEGAVSLRQHLVVGVVFARAVAGRAISVSDWGSRH